MQLIPQLRQENLVRQNLVGQLARDASHIDVQNYGMARQPSQSKGNFLVKFQENYLKTFFFEDRNTTIQCVRNDNYCFD